MKKLSIGAAEDLANKFRTETGISLTEPISFKSILIKKNILTVFRPLSNDSYGLSLKSKNNDYFILVNHNSTLGRQHYTIAHELFHLFYDEAISPHVCSKDTLENNNIEKSADLFASALLMPKSGILEFLSANEIANKSVNLSTIIKLEQYFSVSRISILIRLKSLGLITENKLQELSKIPVKESAKQYGYNLALYNSGNKYLVIGDFGEKARNLYEQEKISEGHYQELLNLISNEKDQDNY